METISHRELRNNSSAVLGKVADGESFAVTNRGEVVAALVPPATVPDLRCVRPARGQRSFSRLARKRVDEPSEVTLAELRGER